MKIFKLFAAALTFILLVNVHVTAQSVWLDMNPIPNWSARSRTILQTKRIPPDELRRCAVAVRQPTLPQDRLLANNGWTLVGSAQVYGRTTTVTVAEGFDGMCRPLNYQTLIFVGSRVAGTLSPGQMDSRTDGSLVNTRLINENNITAEYVRYRASDALCCPYKTEAVTFNIKPDGANFLLTPESKIPIGAGSGGDDEQNESGSLTNTVWRWESLQTPVDKVTVSNPENYTLEFMSDGTVQVQADCNRGRGRYTASGKSISLSGIALTRRACPRGSLDGRFTRSLGAARIFFFQDDALYMDLFADGGTMRFVKSNR